MSVSKLELLRKFLLSQQTMTDILTKNLSAELHEKHSKKMVGKSFKDVVLEMMFYHQIFCSRVFQEPE